MEKIFFYCMLIIKLQCFICKRGCHWIYLYCTYLVNICFWWLYLIKRVKLPNPFVIYHIGQFLQSLFPHGKTTHKAHWNFKTSGHQITFRKVILLIHYGISQHMINQNISIKLDTISDSLNSLVNQMLYGCSYLSIVIKQSMPFKHSFALYCAGWENLEIYFFSIENLSLGPSSWMESSSSMDINVKRISSDCSSNREVGLNHIFRSVLLANS